MSEILVNLIIQAIGGAIGGNAIGATLKNMNLGPLGNTIAGALGGAGGGSILSALIPALSGAGLDIGALAGQFVGGGVTGAIVTAVVFAAHECYRTGTCPSCRARPSQFLIWSHFVTGFWGEAQPSRTPLVTPARNGASPSKGE